MHPRIILAIARKDARDVLLNRTSLLVLLGPICLALIWLGIVTLANGYTTNILIYNPGQSHVEQVVTSVFSNAQVTQASTAAEVTAAFGTSGQHKGSSYAIGLIVPADFDSSLRVGHHLQVSLYINGDHVDSRTSAIVQAAIVYYARTLANPQSPVNVASTIINPPSNVNHGTVIGTAYAIISLLISFEVGTSLTPRLLLEEKEKQTLRMLMITRTSFGDVIAGKLLVVLFYQLALTCVMLAILGGFSGQIPLVLLFVLLGAFFSIALGLFFSSMFQKESVANAVGGFSVFIYLLPGIFIGPLEPFFGNGPFIQALRIVPTYYIVDGVYNAMRNQGTWGNMSLDIGIIVGFTVILLAISAWMLRRLASVIAAI